MDIDSGSLGFPHAEFLSGPSRPVDTHNPPVRELLQQHVKTLALSAQEESTFRSQCARQNAIQIFPHGRSAVATFSLLQETFGACLRRACLHKEADQNMTLAYLGVFFHVRSYSGTFEHNEQPAWFPFFGSKNEMKTMRSNAMKTGMTSNNTYSKYIVP